ncbi:uncharacterized protein A4U43_C08F35860 [Asparagus officinalis]|nr:uncharacterized protein A4U43_C08F35860 [Asparagus officinalis]
MDGQSSERPVSSTSASCSPNPPASSKQLLLETATAISESNLEVAAANLAALKRAGNPRGDPDQRLALMMISALIARINSPPSATLTPPASELCSLEHQTAIQMLYDASPIFKLGHVAANFAILDAARDHPKIHIVDFDLSQGVQYASLINAVSERSRHRSLTLLVNITAVCDPTMPYNTPSTVNNLKIIGDKIVTLASRFGVPVRFSVLNRRASELERASLGCEAGECLAVYLSFALSRIADESASPANPRDQLLRRVKSLGADIVKLVEQEMNANTAPFATRFGEACGHYGSVLDSLDATMSRDDRGRFRIERALGRKASNSEKGHTFVLKASCSG